jgi:hypothetical protein
MNFGNILAQLEKAIMLAPSVIKGIDAIAGEKDSATKKQMAHDSLSLASGIAEAVDPANAAEIEVASAGVSAVIEGVGALLGLFGKRNAKSHSAPVAVSSTSTSSVQQ